MSVEHRYHIGSTGRVKAAGLPMDIIYSPAEEFKKAASINGAYQVTDEFFKLRHTPPAELRDRFFPRDRANKAMFRNGSLLLRPILKTDQGSGQFLPFDFGDRVTDKTPKYQIAYEEGFCMPEPFFVRQLREKGFPTSVMRALIEVQKQLLKLDIHEGQLAYERLQLACEKEDIRYRRRADTGREALFLIRPSIPQEPIVLSQGVQQNIEQAIDQQIKVSLELAKEARQRFAQAHGLLNRNSVINLPPYFQADVQLIPSGQAVVDQILLPDVGLFLINVNAHESESLQEIQKRVIKLYEGVIQSLYSAVQVNNTDHIYLITRDEVLNNDEDLLEHDELAVIATGLQERGVRSTIISLSQTSNLGVNDVGFFLNVDTNSSVFNELLERSLTRQAERLYPDPFLLLTRQEMTQYKRVILNETQIASLRAVVRDVEIKLSPEKIFMQLMALDNCLTKLGVEEEAFHLYISSQPVPVPCFRYDIKGVQIALNYVQPGDQVEVRSIPIDPNKAVLFDAQGKPVYCVFRVMMTKEVL